ncbi:MAG TPA: glycosyltransferase family 1 protein [Pyrinomonadaceae bacterium]|nr:glycosyltransferase family 1 protein [Pyrinomonadaceae bacterium]
MRIALDGMPLASPLTGVGHYTAELARNLAVVAPFDSFTLIEPNGLLKKRWWSLGLPLHLLRNSFDLFHGTNYEVPLWSRRPTVVTIHDLSLLLHPEVHEPRLVRRARWRLPLMAKAASKIITPSSSVKNEVCETFEIPADKIVVTPEAPRPAFKRREDAQIAKLLKRLGIDGEFILFVGTIEPRKNLRRLVEAFDLLLRTTSLSPTLVIAGGQGWLMDDFAALITQKGMEERVCLTGYLDDEDLCGLYSSCAAFVYPSLYEGFGLPPLEAMACGAPVITSRIPSLTETAGSAARLVDPKDIDDIASAMVEMLSDRNLREHYAGLGTHHVKKFSWEQTARQTLEVYQQLHQKRRQD